MESMEKSGVSAKNGGKPFKSILKKTMYTPPGSSAVVGVGVGAGNVNVVRSSMDDVATVSVNGITKLNNDGRAPIAAAKIMIMKNSPSRVRHVTMDPIVDVYEFQAEPQVSNVDVTYKDGQTLYVAASVGTTDARPKVDVGDVTIPIEKVDAGAGAKLADVFESVTNPHARITLHRAGIRTDA
ncbi:hypothetical protein Tco_0845471 [Tanacetum coccineum]